MLFTLLSLSAVVWANPTLSPDSFEVEAEDVLTWSYELGEDGFDIGDELLLIDPELHGMTWGRWGSLSPFPENCSPRSEAVLPGTGLIRPEAYRDGRRVTDTRLGLYRNVCHEVTRECNQDLHLSATNHIFVDSGEPLQPGDEIRVLMGDTVGCVEACEADGLTDCSMCEDCGFPLPARALPKVPLTAELCLDGDCTPLDDTYLEMRAHSYIKLVHVEAPSQAVVGEPFPLKVALLERLGNPITTGPHQVEISFESSDLTTDDETSFALADGGPGWQDIQVVAAAAGVYRVDVEVDGVFVGRSNPVRVTDDPPELSVYWGDIHTHHGLTWIDDEGNVRELNHEYARDVIGLDVVSESVKASGVELSEDEVWDALVEACSRDSVDGSFIVLLGFEWMGRLASKKTGDPDPGHHNVYYDSCEGSYGTHEPEIINSLNADRSLWTWLRDLEAATGIRSLTIPHAMRKTGYDFSNHDRTLQPLAEVYSEWGDNTAWTGENDEGTVPDMINSGLRVGFIGASDNHDGFMGNPHASYVAPGGIAGWLAPSLTRSDIFDAMDARRTIATTGIRPIIDVEIVDGDTTVLPGTEYIAQAPVLRWSYYAHDAIVSVRVVAVDVVEDAPERTLLREMPEEADVSGELTIEVDGSTPQAVWLEVREADREAAWSSPIFLSFDCDRVETEAEDPLGLCSEDTGGDGGAVDGGTADGGVEDGGTTDGGTTDGGTTDGGTADGGTTGGDDSGDGGGDEPCGCSGDKGGSAALLLPLFLLAGRRRR